MATMRGRFSRRRGSSQNLSALIASLMREQRAAEDRQMFDAWKNGGQVDGKAVTDQDLLDYIISRRDSFSQDDPNWTEWNNAYIQNVANIGEGKMALQYQQGNVKATDVAAFYESQLAGLDPNSEQYRQIALAAAKWRNQAKDDTNGEQAALDRAMFDAWQNGGSVDGQPVTDARILEYVQSRIAMFQPGEAAYAQWTNLLAQTKSGIEEKKVSLLFKQGKMTIAEVAQFYKDQAALVSPDSDYGRELLSKAADWQKAADDEATAEKLKKTAAMDKLMFDAFENGGVVDGKKVDDKRLLAYIQERRDSFERDDPAWAEWNNTLIQSEFSIKERRLITDFQQGEVSAKTVAKFYADNLKKFGEDSAFGGQIAKNASDWAKYVKDQAASAAASARASAERALREKYDQQYAKYAQTENAYASLESSVLRAAQVYKGFTGVTTDDLIQMDASDLQDLFDSGMVRGADGTPITYAEWQQATLAAYNNGKAVVATADLLGNETSGPRSRVENLWTRMTLINAVDERALYEDAYAQFERDMDATGEDVFKQQAVIDAFIKKIELIVTEAESDTGTAENSGVLIAAMNNDIAALRGETPNGDGVFGVFFGDKSFTPTVVANMAAHYANVKALTSGKAYQVQETPGGDLTTVALLPNQRIDPNTGFLIGGGEDIQPYVEKSTTFPVYMKGVPVTSAFYYDSRTGQAVNPEDVTAAAIRDGTITRAPDSSTVGYVFTTPTGQTKYGVYTPDGSMVFTDRNPFVNLVTGEGGGLVAIGTATLETTTMAPSFGQQAKQVSTVVPTPDSWLIPGGLTNSNVLLTSADMPKSELLRKALSGTILLSQPQIDYLTQTVQTNIRSGGEMAAANRLRTGERGATENPANLNIGDTLLNTIPSLGAGLRALFDSVRGDFKSDATTGERPPTVAFQRGQTQYDDAFQSPYVTPGPNSGPPTTAFTYPSNYFAPTVPTSSYTPPKVTSVSIAPPAIVKTPTTSGVSVFRPPNTGPLQYDETITAPKVSTTAYRPPATTTSTRGPLA